MIGIGLMVLAGLRPITPKRQLTRETKPRGKHTSFTVFSCRSLPQPRRNRHEHHQGRIGGMAEAEGHGTGRKLNRRNVMAIVSCATPNKASPENPKMRVVKYTVRKLGMMAWEDDIPSFELAIISQRQAHQVAGDGYVIVATRANGSMRIVG